MSHIISPANIVLTVFGLAAIIAAVRFSGKPLARALAFAGTHKRALFAVLPIIGCNATAFTGQLFFFHDHAASWPEIGVILLSATMESIALFLSSEASEREKLGDAAFGIRIASYGFGFIVGVINYSHYAGPDFRPTILAVVFGMMSAISPWLWGIYGRGQSRPVLMEQGLIERRAVKFAKVRWIMWPAETFGAFRLSAWTGERNPDKAIKDYELLQEAKRAEAEKADAVKREAEQEMTLDTATTQADAIRIAVRALGDDAAHSAVAKYLAAASPRAWTVSADRIRQVRASDAKSAAIARRATVRALTGGARP